jgi:cell division protein FtsZ
MRPAAYQPEPQFAAYQAPEPQPVPASEPAPQPAFAHQAAPQGAPVWTEPKRVAFGAEYDLTPAAQAPAPEPEPQADLYAEPVQAAPQPAPKPAPAAAVEPEPEPLAAEAGVEDAPLFPDRSYSGDRRRGGFLGLFGGRARASAEEAPGAASYRQAQTSAPQTRGSAALKPVEEEQPLDATDDLEIPSFLRRLAN